MLTVIAPRVAVPRPDMPKKERYLHASHIVGGLGRRQQPVFFRERKISEYGEWSRWGVSHQGLAKYLFAHADWPLPRRGSLRMNLPCFSICVA